MINWWIVVVVIVLCLDLQLPVSITTKFVSSNPVHCVYSVVFYGYSGFLHQQNWPPRYNWNIVESGVEHHKQNQLTANFELKNMKQNHTHTHTHTQTSVSCSTCKYNPTNTSRPHYSMSSSIECCYICRQTVPCYVLV